MLLNLLKELTKCFAEALAETVAGSVIACLFLVVVGIVSALCDKAQG